MTHPISIVTGGAGFIGSHMVDLLLDHGHTVRVVDNFTGGWEKNIAHNRENPHLEVFDQDIRTLQPDSAIFRDVTYVFHFAGIGDIVPSIENPVEYMDVNVQGTVKVLECARHHKVKKVVYAASSSCYGLADVPTREDAPIKTEYPYALSKYMGEMALFHWNKVYKVPVNAIRIFNCYGPRVRTTGVYGAVFGVFFKQRLAGKPFTIVGDGTQTRDFLFVRDVVKAFYLAAVTPLIGHIWNLGAGNPQSVNKLADFLGEEKVYIPKRPGEPDCTWADITKIQKDLKWVPEVSFEEGVQEMLKDIDRWQDAPLWDQNSIKQATKTWFEYLGAP
ncbi:MAG TPA: NAD-dependent dehydratase [Holosporales bacterium]|nr:MAG: NAD-dependent dehydratase [Alphaproteobacteria bacterium GWB1_45_5]HCI49023.1 NAD-dependent dehydratase [Holosporales bacterium]